MVWIYSSDTSPLGAVMAVAIRTAPRSGSAATARRSLRPGRLPRRRRHLPSTAGISFPTGRSGRSCSMRRRRPPTSAPHVPPDWGSIHGLVAARSGTSFNIATLAPSWRSFSRAGGHILRGTQHHAERSPSCGLGAVRHRVVALDHSLNLGADARPIIGLACSPASRPIALPLDRLLRKLLYEAIEESTKRPRSRRCARPARPARR